MDSIIDMKIDIEMLKSAFGQALKSGPVTHLDADKGYRFSMGKDDEGNDFLSPWMPHPETGKTSIPLKVGQMIGVVAPTGDMRQGLVFRGGYSKDHPSPNTDMTANVFEDAGVRIVVAGGKLTIEASGVSWVFSGAGLKQTGGDVIHNSKSIGDTHKHGDVMPGPSPTGVPI